MLAACALGAVQGCGGSGSAATPPPAAAVPAITAVAPSTVPAGSGAFTLAVTGSGFSPQSVVLWNGTSLTTTYVSATQLTAAVPAALAASAGAFTITVTNPGGQSSSGTGGSVNVQNPVPVITSLSPQYIAPGSPAADVTITGSGFVQSAIASFAGSSRPTAYVSPTQLTMSLTAADVATPGQGDITVTNPSPGGGTSAPIALKVAIPPPSITSLSPASVLVGSPDTQVTIHGTGFSDNPTVLVGALPLKVSSPSSTSLTVTIPASSFGFASPLGITVRNQDWQSSRFNLPILNPVPQILSLSRSAVTAGGPAFLLNIAGTGILTNGGLSRTEVDLNGTAIASSSLHPGTIAVQISGADIAKVGKLTFSLTNPGPGGGSSATATIDVIAGTNVLRAIPVPSNKIAWNPQQQLIYATVPATASSYASSVVAIDPVTGKITASHAMATEPFLIAISDDDQYVYVTLKGSATIARLKLPSLTPDIQWTAGIADGISDLQGAPGLPHTVAVAQVSSSSAPRQLAVYDDGVVRPNLGADNSVYRYSVDCVRWGADASTVYATTTTISGAPELIFSIDPQGATLSRTNLGAVSAFEAFTYDRVESRLYTDEGLVADPASGRLLGHYDIGQALSSPLPEDTVAVDSAAHRVYFVTQVPFNDFADYATANIQIQAFRKDDFADLGKVVIPSEQDGVQLGCGSSLIRWGGSGLALGGGSEICLLDGPFVTPGSSPSSSAGPFVSLVPQLTAVSPESVPAGSPDTAIVVTGHGFSESTSSELERELPAHQVCHRHTN